MFSDTEPFPKVKSQTDADAGSFNGFLQVSLLLTIVEGVTGGLKNCRFCKWITHLFKNVQVKIQ